MNYLGASAGAASDGAGAASPGAGAAGAASAGAAGAASAGAAGAPSAGAASCVGAPPEGAVMLCDGAVASGDGAAAGGSLLQPPIARQSPARQDSFRRLFMGFSKVIPSSSIRSAAGSIQTARPPEINLAEPGSAIQPDGFGIRFSCEMEAIVAPSALRTRTNRPKKQPVPSFE
jgi:hypothetical protein